MTLTPLDATLLETTLRVTVLLAGVLGLAALARRSAGSVRHALWSATAVALLALPFLSGVLPTASVPWPTTLLRAPTPQAVEAPAASADDRAAVGIASGTAWSGPLVSDAAEPISGRAAPAARPVPPLVAVWLLGALLALVTLVRGMLSARGVITRAVPVTEPWWLERLTVAMHAAGVESPVDLRVSAEVEIPMTGGLARPVILLPASAAEWEAECLDVVLLHEMVHVRRRDVARQLLSRLAVAVYWFHPLAWSAARRAMLAREQACDEAVLAAGTRPSRYAHYLVTLADREEAPWRVPAMVGLDHAHLEERVMSILHHARPRGGRLLAALVGSGVLALAAAAASLGPAEARAQSVGEPVVVEAPVTVAAVPAVPAEPVLADVAVPMAVLEAPLAPVAPVLGPRVEPCEISGLRRGVSVANERDGRASRTVTERIDGVRICGAVSGARGSLPDGRFIPAGRLPEGMQVVLAAVGPDVEQRMVITRGQNGNDHAWFVGGERRPFDAEAAAWRDAMITVLESRVEVATMHGEAAALHGEVAAVEGAIAAARGEVAMVRGERAARAARVASEVAAAQGRTAEVDEMRAREEVMRVEAEVLERQAEAMARQAEIRADQLERIEAEAARETDPERRAVAARAIEAERRALAQVRESAERGETVARAQEVRERAVTMAREADLRRADAEAELADRRATAAVSDAEVARVEGRVAVRVAEAERERARVRARVEALDVDRRTAEIERRSSPAQARLLELMRKIGS